MSPCVYFKLHMITCHTRWHCMLCRSKVFLHQLHKGAQFTIHRGIWPDTLCHYQRLLILKFLLYACFLLHFIQRYWSLIGSLSSEEEKIFQPWYNWCHSIVEFSNIAGNTHSAQAIQLLHLTTLFSPLMKKADIVIMCNDWHPSPCK